MSVPLLIAVLFIFTGCAIRQPPFMIGIYSVSQKQLSAVAAEGFDLVASPADVPYLREADQYGVKVLAQSGAMRPLDANRRAKLITMDRQTALWAWYLVDEPDLHRIAPTEVHSANRYLKKFVRKPTMVVLSSGAAVERYRACADYLAVDWYPIPWAPISTFAREMRLARLGAAEKPFYSIIQAFDWSAFSEMIKTEQMLREPTYEEMRCMSYLALANGARGLLFYTYSEPKWEIKEHPKLWSSLEQLVVELRADAPLFNNRVPWFPLETNHNGAEFFNEVYDQRVQVSMFRVSKSSGEITPGYYFSIINTTAEPLTFSFQIPFEPVTNKIKLLHSEVPIRLKDQWFTKSLGGYESVILGPILPLRIPGWLE